MHNFNENNITQEVIKRLTQCSSERTRQISKSLVQHLHDFIRDIEPTREEWTQAIRFLSETGQMRTDTRQEFILLSDALGVSMLVDAINHRFLEYGTETTVLGPFYVENAPERALGDAIDRRQGPPLLCEGVVTDVTGVPIEGAIIDTWHADAEGFYDVQSEGGKAALTGRARLRTDAKGRYWFRTIAPRFYAIPDDGPVGRMLQAQGRHPNRPAHVHFIVHAPGYETLITHVFLAGDPYLDSDVVFGVKDSLIQELAEQPVGLTPCGHTALEAVSLLRYDFALINA